jgi:Cu(I)/Ag(I) efflux system protein CusF
VKTLDVLFVLAMLGLPAAHAAGQQAGAAAAATAPLSEGEIRKVDKVAGKLTIKHGPLENLGMPGMTMVFRVKDAAMLDQVTPGDRVRFLVEKINGVLTVTRIEAITP